MLRRIRDAKLRNGRPTRQQRLDNCKWILHCDECPAKNCEQRKKGTESEEGEYLFTALERQEKEDILRRG